MWVGRVGGVGGFFACALKALREPTLMLALQPELPCAFVPPSPPLSYL